MFVVNSLRLLAFVLSRGIIFHIPYELKGYFLPCTTLYLTNEYFYGGLIQSYFSLEDIQKLTHDRYKPF